MKNWIKIGFKAKHLIVCQMIANNLSLTVSNKTNQTIFSIKFALHNLRVSVVVHSPSICSVYTLLSTTLSRDIKHTTPFTHKYVILANFVTVVFIKCVAFVCSNNGKQINIIIYFPNIGILIGYRGLLQNKCTTILDSNCSQNFRIFLIRS